MGRRVYNTETPQTPAVARSAIGMAKLKPPRMLHTLISRMRKVERL